jgi:hyperosmotically inducible periplasmic protein
MQAITTLKPTTRFAGVSLLLAAAFGCCFGLATAQAEGLAEKAGQQMDRVADKAGQMATDVKESAGRTADSTGEYMDDSAITAKVKWAILRDPDLKTLDISVATTGGVVSLTGAVDSQESIHRAGALARDNPAVKSVENHLTVKAAK